MVDVIWTVSTPLPGFFVLLHFDTTSTALLSFWVSFYGVKRALVRMDIPLRYGFGHKNHLFILLLRTRYFTTFLLSFCLWGVVLNIL
jgi:hypothetical protein